MKKSDTEKTIMLPLPVPSRRPVFAARGGSGDSEGSNHNSLSRREAQYCCERAGGGGEQMRGAEEQSPRNGVSKGLRVLVCTCVKEKSPPRYREAIDC